MRRMFTEKQVKELAGEKATEVIESGLIENAKPIYCHPITLQLTATKIFRITCLIFNNDATPFTLATFKTYIDNLYTQIGATIRIMISGAYNTGTKVIIVSHLSKADDSNYSVNGIGLDGANEYTTGTWNTVFPDTSSFNDGVNKIN